MKSTQSLSLTNVLKRLVPLERDELAPVLLATAYGFCILLSYYILRPVRDEISSADRENLQILWTAVFFVMLIAVPLYSVLVSRFSRGVFIPLANRFFASNILLFFLALQYLPEGARPWIDRIFYVWTSVFALFVVTVFWGFIADLFRNHQGRRLYGIIAVGSSLGGIAGSLVTVAAVEFVPVFILLVISVVPLEVAARLAGRLHAHSRGSQTVLRVEEPGRIPGGALSGIKTVFQSPYLFRIASYLALMTFASTVLYFQQAELLRDAFSDRTARTSVYAQIDLAVNVLTIFTQGFLAAHIIRKIGIGLSLAFLPAAAALGFLALGVYPLVAILIVVQVLYRSGRYAVARPAREVLFTVVGREERYKSKAFIDAAVYRGGDLASGWIYTGLAAIGLSLGAIALVAVPVAAAWAMVGFTLGKRQEELLATGPTESRAPTPAEPTRTGAARSS